MSSFDDFCGDLIEQAKHFLEKSKRPENDDAFRAYLNASLLLSMSALEAYINGISSELLHMPKISVLERSILAEKEYHLKNGRFELKSTLKIYRTTDRIVYIYRKFSNNTLNGDDHKWWIKLKESIKLRNDIVHPKEEVVLKVESVQKALEAVIECINVLCLAVNDVKFPKHNRGLQSIYDF